eukprot:m.1637119 g.1637119  ORF g.1637119 m.1637119 type:complete len:2167 (+) comp25481_c0_seq1:68-6568(+)
MRTTRTWSTAALIAVAVATMQQGSVSGMLMATFQSPEMHLDYCNRTWGFPNSTVVLSSDLTSNMSAVSDYQMRYSPNVSYTTAQPSSLYSVLLEISLNPAISPDSNSSQMFPLMILTDVNGSSLSTGFNVSAPPSGLTIAQFIPLLWNSSIPTQIYLSVYRQTNGTLNWSGGTPSVTMSDRFDFNSWMVLHNVSSQVALSSMAMLRVFDSVWSYSQSDAPCPSELVQMSLPLAAAEDVHFASTMTSPLFVSWTYTDSMNFTQCNSTYTTPPAAYFVDPADGFGAYNTFSTLQTYMQPDVYFYGANASKNYSLFVIDSTYPTMPFLHWAVVNVPGATVGTGGLASMGDELSAWIPPFNQDAFDHTYTFYVYEQTTAISVQLNTTNPFLFNMSAFSSMYQLGPQVAGNWIAVFANPVFTRWFSELTLTSQVPCETAWAAELAANATAQGIALPLVAAMGEYPGWAWAHPAGTVTVESAQGPAPLLIMYDMSGLPASSSGGMHIHSGTTCDAAALVGGHYWQPMNMTDPWNVIMWTSDASGRAVGNVTVTSGFGYGDNIGHALVVHASNGTRIGCGVLQSTLTQQVDAFFYQNGSMSYTACGETRHLPQSVSVLNSQTTLYGNARDGNRITVVDAVNAPSVTFAGVPGKLYTVLLVHEAPKEVAASEYGATLHYATANMNMQNTSVAQGLPLSQIGGTMWYGNIAPYMPAYTYGAAPGQFVFYIYEQTGVVDVATLAGRYMNFTARENFSRHQYLQDPAAMVGPLVGFQFANVFYDIFEAQLLHLLFPSLNTSDGTHCPTYYLSQLQAAGAATGVNVPSSIRMALDVVWDTPPTTGIFVCGQNMMFPRHVMGMNPTVPKGNDLTTAFTRAQPIVYALQYNASANYTLIMTDETIGFLHWLVVNIPGSMLNTGVKDLGDTLAPYFPPGNPNEMPHQYVFRLAEQTMWVNPTNKSITNLSSRLLLDFLGSGEGTFDVQAFMTANGILPPYAQTWGSVWTSLFSVWALDVYASGMFGTVPCPQSAAMSVAQNATSVGLYMPQAASIARYPEFTGMGPMGNITVQSAQGAGPLSMFYYLTGLPANSSGGFHIHTGTSCSVASLVGGHYWQPMSAPDPWNVVMWTSDMHGIGIGNVTVTSGFGYTENAGHAVVIHANNGTRIGCGTLQSTLVMRADVSFYIPETTNFSVCNKTITTQQQQRTINPIFPDTLNGNGRGDRLTESQTVNEPIIAFNGVPGKYYSVLMVDQVKQFLGSESNYGESSFVHLAIANIPGESAATGVSGAFSEGDVLLPYLQPVNPAGVPHGYVVYVLEQSMMVNASMFNTTMEYLRHGLDVYTYASPAMYGPMTFVGTNYVEIFTDYYSQYFVEVVNSSAYGFTHNFECPMQMVADASAQNMSGVSFGGLPQTEVQIVSPLWVSYNTLSEVKTICNASTVLPRVMTAVDPVSPKGDFLTVSQVRNPPTASLYDLNTTMLYTVLLYGSDAMQLYWAVGDVLGADLMTGLYGSPSGTVLQSYLPPITTESFIELTFMVFEQPTGSLPPYISALLGAFDGPGLQLPAFVTAANLGNMVATNFMKVYADSYVFRFLNTDLMGIYGSFACPAVGVPYLQTAYGAGASASTGASAAVGSAETILSVAYRPQAMNLTTTCGDRFPISGGLQLGDPVVPIPFAATRVPPNVSAYYTLGSGLNASVLYSLVTFSKVVGTSELFVNWVVKDINSSGIVTGVEGTTVLPYELLMVPVGVVQYEFYLVPQLSNFSNVTTRSVVGNVMQFFGANNLGAPVAFNIFRTTPDTYQLITASMYNETCSFSNLTGQPVTTCDSSNGVMIQDGHCVPDCTGMLRLRRACTACQTSLVEFTLTAAPIDIPRAVTAITAALAQRLSITSSAMSVGVNETEVEVVLPISSAGALTAAINTGNLSFFNIDGTHYELEALITAAPTTAAPTTLPLTTAAGGASITSSVSNGGVPDASTPASGTVSTMAPGNFNGPVLTLTFLGNLDSLSTANQGVFIQQIDAAIVSRSNNMILATQFRTVLQAGSILSITKFVDSVNETVLNAVVASVNAHRLNISVGGLTYESEAATLATSDAGTSGSGGLSGGAKAAIAIVVLLTLCIVVYAVLVKMDKAPNVLNKLGGSGAKKQKNPYATPGRTTGSVPNAAYSETVTMNQTYDYATEA